jgi:hypothetical protein
MDDNWFYTVFGGGAIAALVFMAVVISWVALTTQRDATVACVQNGGEWIDSNCLRTRNPEATP